MFGPCPYSWHRAPGTLGISQGVKAKKGVWLFKSKPLPTPSECVLMRWLWENSEDEGWLLGYPCD